MSLLPDTSLFQSAKSIETFGSKDPTWMGPPGGVDAIDVSIAPSKPAVRGGNNNATSNVVSQTLVLCIYFFPI